MNPSQRFLKAITGRERPRNKIVCFDIETDGLGGPFICGAWLAEGDDEPVIFHQLDELINAMMSYRYRQHTWYAHNGGAYDFKYLIAPLVERISAGKIATVKPVVQGEARVIGLRLTWGKNRMTELRDSRALLDESLAGLAALFAPELPKLDIGISQGVTFDPGNPEHIAYLVRDVEALRAVLLRFDSTLLDSFGVHMQYTAARTALRAWQRTIEPDRVFIRQRDEVEQMARRAYFGGLTTLTTTRKQPDVLLLDVNAMYAAAMRRGVPLGAGCYTTRYMPGLPGIYDVIVTCPEDHPFPIIGRRLDDGVHWATGTFETSCTSVEIEAARARGYTIEIVSGFCFETIGSIFGDFIDQCELLEIANQDNAIKRTIKALRVALYGKFGTRKERKDYILSEQPPDGYSLTFDPHADRATVVEYLYWRDIVKEQACMMPVWAAWITATARLLLLDLVEHIGMQDLIYVDTDAVAIYTRRARQLLDEGVIELGTRYGQLKVVDEYRHFQAAAPKEYGGQRLDRSFVTRARSIPRRVAEHSAIERAARGEQVRVETIEQRSTLALLRDPSLPLTYPSQRVYATISGTSERWQRDAQGTIRPRAAPAPPLQPRPGETACDVSIYRRSDGGLHELHQGISMVAAAWMIGQYDNERAGYVVVIGDPPDAVSHTTIM